MGEFYVEVTTADRQETPCHGSNAPPIVPLRLAGNDPPAHGTLISASQESTEQGKRSLGAYRIGPRLLHKSRQQ